MRTKATIGSRLPVRRGLGREEAAVYIGVSPSHFDALVNQEIMPRPRVAGSRLVWDIDELDFAFRDLPRKGESTTNVAANSWSDYR